MDKEDDELNIDFSGVKKFFKRDSKQEHQKPTHEHAEEKDDETLDLGAVKNWLGSAFKPKKGEEEAGLGKAAGFIGKYKMLLFLTVAVMLSIYIRMLATNAPYTDEWASNYIVNNLRSNIAGQVDQQYPNLPAASKDALINEQLAAALKSQKAQIASQTTQVSAQIKEFFKDDQGDYYMPDIDPYYWYRYSKNILQTGSPADVLVNGQPYDNHQLAPIGKPISKADYFHPEFLAKFHKVLTLFNSKLTPMQTMQYYPVFVSALVVAIIFFIARRITNDVGGLFAAVMIALNPGFLNRTLFGHADTDALVIFFPVLVSWLFLEAFEAKNRKVQVGLSLLSGVGVGVYAAAWNGYIHVFAFVIATLAAVFAHNMFIHRKELMHNPINFLKQPAIVEIFVIGISFVAATAIVASYFTSVQDFISSPLALLGFTALKTPVLGDLWPNTLTTVAELNDGSLDQVIATVGGTFLFSIALLGILFSMFRTERHGKRDLKAAFLLIIWFIATTYAGIKGIRFTILLVPAFSVAFGVFAGMAYNWLTVWIGDGMKLNKALTSVSVAAVLACLFIFPVNMYAQARSVATHDVPLVNDAWYNALTKIKTDSAPNAIITSWWDFGHHFKALADRAVTFDGTTQDTPSAHWVGKILSTDNEELAVGILRMLDCGNYEGYNELFKYTKDTHKTWDRLYELLVMNRADALKALKANGLTDSEAGAVLKLTHCDPPDAYFIASEDMIGKAGVWAHFGAWDFQRAWIYRYGRNLPKDEAVSHMVTEFNMTQQTAESLYYEAQALFTDAEGNSWVSPWPGYVSQGSCTAEGAGNYTCTNSLGNQQLTISVNLQNPDAYFQSNTGLMRLHSLVYPDGNEIKELVFEGNTIPYSIILVPQGALYASVIASPEIANGMFTRLFYLQGQGLRHFKLFDRQSGLTGTNIYVWKVDWNGTEPNAIAGMSRQKATVNYLGWYENGTVFDSSIISWQSRNITKDSAFEPAANTFSFVVGASESILGFDEAVAKMKVNQTSVVKIPPEKAYGTDPAAHPLGNRTLYFKIRVESLVAA